MPSVSPVLKNKEYRLDRMSNSLEIIQEYREGILNNNEIIFKYVLWCVSTFTGVKHSKLLSSLDRKSSDARALCCFIIYVNSSMSLSEIARRFGRTKSGVHKSIVKMQFAVETPGLYQEFTQIAEMTAHLIDTYIQS